MFKHPLPSSSSARLYFWTLFALKWLYVQKIYKLQLLKSFYSWDNISHKGRFVRLNHCFFNAVKLGILLLTLRKNLMNKNKSCTLHCAQELVLHQIFIPTALLLMNDIYCRKQHFLMWCLRNLERPPNRLPSTSFFWILYNTTRQNL